MKKALLLLTMLALKGYGQQTDIKQSVEIVDQPAIIVNSFPSDQPGTHTFEKQVKVKMSSTEPPDADVEITFQIMPSNLKSTPKLLPGSEKITIPKDKWSNGVDTTLSIKFSIDACSNCVNFDEVAYITCSTQGQGKGQIELRVSPYDVAYDKDKPFWVEVGSNFDLIDHLQADNLFGGVFFYQKDIRSAYFISQRTLDKSNSELQAAKNKKIELSRQFDTTGATDSIKNVFNKKMKNIDNKIKTKQKTYDTKLRHYSDKNLGLFAGLYESKSTSLSNNSDKPLSYYDSSSFIGVPKDSALLHTDIAKTKSVTQVKNVAIFFSPTIRLTNKSANENGMHIFLSFYGEVQWQSINYSYRFSDVHRIKDSLHQIDNLIGNYNSFPSENNYNIFSHYEGFGLPIVIKTTVKSDDINLFINPVAGMSNQPKTVNDISTLKDISENIAKRQWHPFYLVQFRLSEENTGITFSGEVRGLLQDNSPPFITLILSKKFDLAKWLNYNGKGIQ